MYPKELGKGAIKLKIWQRNGHPVFINPAPLFLILMLNDARYTDLENYQPTTEELNVDKEKDKRPYEH